MLKKFTKFWDEEIKPFANKCAEGMELLHKIQELDEEKDQDKVQEIKEQMNAYNKKDWLALYNISQMIFYVEHDLADGRNPAFRMHQVKSCLSSESYYTNVFKNEDCEESRNYKKLAEMLSKGMLILRN